MSRMRSLVATGLLAVGAAGCIISSDDSSAYCGNHVLDPGEACDDGNNVDGDGCSQSCTVEPAPHRTTATWSFQTVAGGVATGCSSTFDTAVLVSQKVDASAQPIGACAPNDAPSETCAVDGFACAAGTGASRKLPDLKTFPGATGGTYLTYVAITSHDRSQVYAQTLADLEDLATADQAFPGDPQHEHGTIYTDGGRFKVAWSLVGATGLPRTCAEASSGGVVVHSTIGGATQSIDATFACDDRTGYTHGLVAGAYAVVIGAIDKGTPPSPLGTQVSRSNEAVHGPASGACPTRDCVTDLGMVVLDVDGP